MDRLCSLKTTISKCVRLFNLQVVPACNVNINKEHKAIEADISMSWDRHKG